MRNLDEVINQMMPIVPEKLGQRFMHMKEKIAYTPPESMDVRWFEAQEELNRFLPATPKELNEWQKKALKIWTGKEY